MLISHENNAAKYKQLVKQLRSQIQSGTYPPGSKLPSENQLTVNFKVSRQTVRQALGILEQDGLVVRRRGSGTYVPKNRFTCTPRKTIGVIAAHLTDYIFPTIIKGIDHELSKNGYALSLCNTCNSVEKEKQILLSFLHEGVDGLIVEGTRTAFPNPNISLYHKLEEFDVPIVFFNGYYRELADSVYVVTDDRLAGTKAADLLLKGGCTHLGGIFKSDNMQGLERYTGFAQAIVSCGGNVNSNAVSWFSDETKNDFFIEPNGSKILNVLRQCDGIVCYNDLIAYHAIHILEENGIEIPAQISVVGCDNASISDYSPIKITTFAHPKEEMGRKAAKLLLKMIESGTKIPPYIFSMPLIEKDSTIHILA